MIEVENRSGQLAPEANVRKLMENSFKELGLHADCELTLAFIDEIEMEDLHIEWMDLPGPTDVLSFPMDELKPFSAAEGPGIIGDIVLCPEFAAKQAKSTVSAELALLTIHGVLHLLGFDHANKEEEKEMFDLQEKILKEWQAS